jgi:predicted TPR repeat methyltransferase
VAAFLVAAADANADRRRDTRGADDAGGALIAAAPPLAPSGSSAAAARISVAPPRYVRSLFDGCAETFEGTLIGSLKYQGPKLLENLLNRHVHLTGHGQGGQRLGDDPLRKMSIFDAGCGTGLCGQWLARYRGHLVGVDLSRAMIAQAKARGIYDELVVGDIIEELQNRPGAFDLIVAGDVLVYFGDLAPFFAAAAGALKPGGMFLFSTEAASDGDYTLLPTQRFAHSMAYLTRICQTHHLKIILSDEDVIRLEKGADVQGYVVLAEKLA